MADWAARTASAAAKGDTMGKTTTDHKEALDGTQPDYSELRSLAASLALQAGDLVESMRDTIDESAETKSSSVDLVTAADKAAEALIVDGILRVRPDDGILGEEGGERPSTSGVRWIIDPIDGTTNFVYNIPAYGISIAAEFNGTTVAGVVFQPATQTLFEAELGGGSRRDGTALQVNDRTDLDRALLATGFGYLAERRRDQAEVLLDILPNVRDIRRFGSAALDLCFLAAGQIDAYYERGLNDWDMAAGLLIAAEAGATTGNLRGQAADTGFTLASAPGLFRPLRDLLVAANADQRS